MRVGGIKIEQENCEDLAIVPLPKIAKAMGRIVRFAGNTDYPVSDLMHCVHGALYCLETYKDVQLARFFALHDSCEVLTGDVIHGFKSRTLTVIEDMILDSMYDTHVGVRPDITQRGIIKRVDELCSAAEINVFGLNGCPRMDTPAKLDSHVHAVAHLWPYEAQFRGSIAQLRDAWVKAVEGDFSFLIACCAPPKELTGPSFFMSWDDYCKLGRYKT